MLCVGLLVVVFGAVCGSLEPQPGDSGLLDSNSRLDRVERFLRLQNDKLSSQGNLIRQLNAEVLRQENLIRQLNGQLSHHENLLQQQEDRYGALLYDFRALQRQLRRDERGGHSSALSSPPKADARQREGAGAADDDVVAVGRRSDDMGPLEAVVSQLSQTVAEMKSDVDAYKLQTAGDILALQAQTSADIQTLTAGNHQQDLDIQDARTSTFVQWGSATCGANSSLVYSGVVGGSDWDDSGASANFLCLTLSPVLLDKDTGAATLLYGGEYETHDASFNRDPVCAVCRSAYAATVTIPGTNVCGSGWHVQYSGYLMAGRNTHHSATEYICVDSQLGHYPGSDDDKDGKLLYYTRTRCGSLPCSPYAEDKVVTCVVCSQ